MHRCNTEKEEITLTENQIRKIVRITLEEMEGRAEEPYIKIRQEVEKNWYCIFPEREARILQNALHSWRTTRT